MAAACSEVVLCGRAMRLAGVLVAVLVLGARSQQVARREIVISTRQGQLRGRLEYAEAFGDTASVSRFYYAFRGIPYAKPPTGERRWKDPEPAGSWSGILDARSFRSFCPQYDTNSNTVEGDEDCLYINVFTPFLPGQLTSGEAPPRASGGRLLPVLVAVHGGDFQRGAASLLGPQRMMREDVVLVTINYRLGALGFFCSGDEELPGNYGLLDVIGALEWVRDSARDFAGDPGQVTLAGHGAGAAIAHILTMSPRAEGLFRRVVLQSGSSLCPWAIQREPEEAAELLADALDCSADDRQCLMTKSAEQLVRQQQRQRFVRFGLQQRPVLDAGLRSRPVLPAEPRALLKSRRATPLPLLTGRSREEALRTVLYVYLEAERPTDGEYMEEEVVDWILAQLFSFNYSHPATLVEAVKRQYMAGVDFSKPEQVIPRLSELLTDGWYGTCLDQTVRLHAAAAPVYAYLFGHRLPGGPSHTLPLATRLLSRGLSADLLQQGVGHGDELLYLYRSPLSFGQYSAADQYMSEVLTTFWANFARSGAPTRSGADPSGRPPWLPSSPGQVAYYNLSVSPLPMLPDYKAREAAFWTETLAYIQQQAATSYAFEISTWLLLVLCLLLGCALVAALIVCRARGRKDGYDSDDVISRVMRSVRNSTTG